MNNDPEYDPRLRRLDEGEFEIQPTPVMIDKAQRVRAQLAREKAEREARFRQPSR
jgi:hypothetical protein